MDVEEVIIITFCKLQKVLGYRKIAAASLQDIIQRRQKAGKTRGRRQRGGRQSRQKRMRSQKTEEEVIEKLEDRQGKKQ